MHNMFFGRCAKSILFCICASSLTIQASRFHEKKLLTHSSDLARVVEKTAWAGISHHLGLPPLYSPTATWSSATPEHSGYAVRQSSEDWRK